MVDSTTTTLTEIVNSEVIHDVIQDYLADLVVAMPYGLFKDISSAATLTVAFPQWVSDVASFEEPAEGAALTAVALETEEETPITVGQMGMARDFTRRALKNTMMSREELMDFAVADTSRILGLAIDDDFVALFGSLTNSVGTTTVNLALADLAAAIGQLGIDNANIPGRKAFILHGVQNSDLLQAYVASQATAIAEFYVAGSDRALNSGAFMGVPIKFTNQVDTANLGADRAGALIADGGDPMNQEHACIGFVQSEAPTPYMFVSASTPGKTTVSVVADWAVGLIEPTRGVGVVTDA